jgi:hypothetical protein
MNPSVHWTSKYVGLPYTEGSFDCADLARLVQKEVFFRKIDIPASRDYSAIENASTSAKFRAMAAQIDRVKGDVAKAVEDPIEGDAVLLRSRGYHQHIGTVCWIAGEKWILHASDRSGQVTLQRERDLMTKGYSVEGYYRWV